jgi:hypothetical protein
MTVIATSGIEIRGAFKGIQLFLYCCKKPINWAKIKVSARPTVMKERRENRAKEKVSSNLKPPGAYRS